LTRVIIFKNKILNIKDYLTLSLIYFTTFYKHLVVNYLFYKSFFINYQIKILKSLLFIAIKTMPKRITFRHKITNLNIGE